MGDVSHRAAGHHDGVFLRAQPARVVDGRTSVGYTGKYEVICPVCGDDPNLNYDQVSPELQKLRGPHSALANGVAALDEHLSSMPHERARC